MSHTKMELCAKVQDKLPQEWEDQEEANIEKIDAMAEKRKRRYLPKTKDFSQSMSRIEAFTESFLGVPQGADVPEPFRKETAENADPMVDPLLLSAINPYSKRLAVVPIRIAFILAVYCAALSITFLEDVTKKYAIGVGVAAIVSPVLVRLCLFISERKVFRTQYDRKKKGQWPMVDWLSFTLFMDAVYNTLRAAKEKGDPRDSDAIRSFAGVYDERSEAVFDEEGRFFFDFVADTGDGFDPTFTVAHLLGQKSLMVEERENGKRKQVELPRARVVCHGGDICYPFSTYENFFYRFIQPYAWAFPRAASTGETMYLAAGNHEYMDGLAGFRNVILPRKRIGGWLTPQRSSYFAIQLPRGWTMFVLDIGAEPEDIDEYQQNWFDALVKKMDKDERIILMYHVPDWVKCGNLGFSNMARLREWRKSLGSRVRLVLTGDLHYYRRMEDEDEDEESDADGKISSSASLRIESSEVQSNCFTTSKTQYMIVGNGGAFNHATHFPAVERSELVGEDRHVVVANEYPSVHESKKVWEEHWPYMFVSTTNHIYSRVLGGVYMIMFMAMTPMDYSSAPWANLILASITSAFFYIGVAWMLVVHHIMVTANFEINTLKKLWTSSNLIIWHTFAHVVFAMTFRLMHDQLFLFVFEKYILDSPKMSFSWQQVMGFSFIGNIWMYIAGSIIGPLVTMVYFWLSLNFFDWHYNEAISVIQIQDYKGFLRLAINADGDIEMYSIVADKTPHNWSNVPVHQRTEDFPAALKSSKLKYRLLEKVTLKKFKK